MNNPERNTDFTKKVKALLSENLFQQIGKCSYEHISRQSNLLGIYISRQTIGRIINKNHCITLDKFIILCLVLEISPNELLGWTNVPKMKNYFDLH